MDIWIYGYTSIWMLLLLLLSGWIQFYRRGRIYCIWPKFCYQAKFTVSCQKKVAGYPVSGHTGYTAYRLAGYPVSGHTGYTAFGLAGYPERNSYYFR